jgi:hypothetical protein
MRKNPSGSWYLTGAYGNGKTHLLYAQYRDLVTAGQVRCHVRTTRELVGELLRVEFDDDFVSPVIAAASRRANCVPGAHVFSGKGSFRSLPRPILCGESGDDLTVGGRNCHPPACGRAGSEWHLALRDLLGASEILCDGH